jgi:hypothetical protein
LDLVREGQSWVGACPPFFGETELKTNIFQTKGFQGSKIDLPPIPLMIVLQQA